MSKYSIRLNDTTNGNIVFEGYFVVNSSNIVVEMYETINGVTSTNNIVVLDRVPLEPYSENNYLGFQIYEGYIDYAYLPSWKKFDNYGVVINSASKYPETTTMIYLFSENLGDETSSNLGLFVYGLPMNPVYIQLPVSYTITPITTNIDAYPTLNSYRVLAYSGMTTSGTTIITNGKYGSYPTEPGLGFTGTNDSTQNNVETARNELTILTNTINSIAVTETINGTVGNQIITYYPGRYNSATTIVFNSGTQITVDASGNSNAQFFFTAGTDITFTGVTSITLQNGAQEHNVFWVAGTSITFSDPSPTPTIPGNFIAGTAITFAGASAVTGGLYAKTTNVTFAAASSVACYAKGSLLLTNQGYVPIENIKVGDTIVTKGEIYNNESIENENEELEKPVVWISKFKVNYLDLKSRPICIQKNALGNCPFDDLYVSPGHRVIVDHKMIIAKDLVNGTTIYQDMECSEVEYYHLEFDKHCAIFANGVLSESYLDMDNFRDIFE